MAHDTKLPPLKNPPHPSRSCPPIRRRAWSASSGRMPGAASYRSETRAMSASDLIWPAERPRAAAPGSEWSQARSNLCLDFHGDPASAQLVVFSDGNHHMALAECVESFVRRTPGLHEVFYTTTPPSVYLTLLRTGELNLGNLTLRVRPNVVIGPRDVVERLHAEGETGAPAVFACSRATRTWSGRGIRRGFGEWPICSGRTWSRSCRIPTPRPRATMSTRPSFRASASDASSDAWGKRSRADRTSCPRSANVVRRGRDAAHTSTRNFTKPLARRRGHAHVLPPMSGERREGMPGCPPARESDSP